MKTIIKLVTVLAVALVAFGQHSAASAGGGIGFNFKGPTAIAYFLNVAGCTITDVLVIASEARAQAAPGQPTERSFASVSIVQTDTCTGATLFQASGTTSPLSRGELQISNTLSSASLNTTVSVFDVVSGTNFDLDINLTWTATGPLSRDQSNSQIHTPGCITNSHWLAKSRVAEASGSISDGAMNFIGTSVSIRGTSLSLVQSGTVTVGCS